MRIHVIWAVLWAWYVALGILDTASVFERELCKAGVLL